MIATSWQYAIQIHFHYHYHYFSWLLHDVCCANVAVEFNRSSVHVDTQFPVWPASLSACVPVRVFIHCHVFATFCSVVSVVCRCCTFFARRQKTWNARCSWKPTENSFISDCVKSWRPCEVCPHSAPYIRKVMLYKHKLCKYINNSNSN